MSEIPRDNDQPSIGLEIEPSEIPEIDLSKVRRIKLDRDILAAKRRTEEKRQELARAEQGLAVLEATRKFIYGR